FQPIQNGTGLFWIGFFFCFSSSNSKISGMRIRIAAGVVLAGLAGLAVIFYLKPRSHPAIEKVPEVVTTAPLVTPAVPKAAPVVSTPPLKPLVSTPVPNTPPMATPISVAPGVTVDDPVVQAKINRLEELQANDDAESLREILSELTNPNPIIRHV